MGVNCEVLLENQEEKKGAIVWFVVDVFVLNVVSKSDVSELPFLRLLFPVFFELFEARKICKVLEWTVLHTVLIESIMYTVNSMHIFGSTLFCSSVPHVHTMYFL